jgi:hypothetical protein
MPTVIASRSGEGPPPPRLRTAPRPIGTERRRLVFDRALVLGQKYSGPEDEFEVEQAAEKKFPAAFTRPDEKPPAPIYADILRGGSSSSGNGQT